jgi:hypothetical protein
MRKILLQALVEDDESSVKCEADNATVADVLTAFSYICEAMIKSGINPSALKMTVDFATSLKHNQDIE